LETISVRLGRFFPLNSTLKNNYFVTVAIFVLTVLWKP